jgi:hypothetical protein
VAAVASFFVDYFGFNLWKAHDRSQVPERPSEPACKDLRIAKFRRWDLKASKIATASIKGAATGHIY